MNIPKQIQNIYNGDPRVVSLLGMQKKPKKDELLRNSIFIYKLYINNHYLFFHTLTRQILFTEPETIEWFIGGKKYPQDVLQNETAAWLYDHYFLVPEDEKESRTYMEVKDLIILKENRSDEMTNYVILPTTACNARCFYCFENGMRYRHMTEETIQNTIHFILNHRPSHNHIHIHWFGGEPTVVPKIIDRICDSLMESGIELDSEMTSNGSLLDEILSKRAKEKWRVNKIQITLDGMEEEYIKRKRYISTVKDPFKTVISNIHHLLKEDIRTAIRLNADENNIGELYRCVDFINQEFSLEEKKKMVVYARSLFGHPGCPVGFGADELEEAVNDLNHYIVKNGITPKDVFFVLKLKSSFCMVTVPENGTVIDAEGRLFACEGMPDNLRYGDIKNGIDPNLWKRIIKQDRIRKHCETCAFLPQCTEFSRCLNKKEFDFCRRQEERVLKNDLCYTYSFFADREKQKEREQQKQISSETDIQH